MGKPTYEQLREYYDTTYGTWMIDRDPKEVDIGWIRKNAFQTRLTDADKICKDTSYMEGEDKDLFENLEEYKNSMSSRMADQLDGMIASNRENIRMKRLEAALKFAELKANEPLEIGYAQRDKITNHDIKSLAEDFYKFVKGE